MPTTSSTRRLNRETEVDERRVDPPVADHFDLPEKILQFGTGAFLRGFSDVFVDEANRRNMFGGRIVVVGSTGSGRADIINKQDGLYTVCVQGIQEGEVVDQCRIVGSISRAIASVGAWQDVVAFVGNPDLELVISNTTEVGIRFESDDRPEMDPPSSFPGKLTVLLHERARAFDYDLERGLVILCCELIENNGDRLREIVLRLADRWQLGDPFTSWVKSSCRFCNTLVDRIVPGRPDAATVEKLETRLGYRDELVVQAEPYGLWAIEGDDVLRDELAFTGADPGIVVTPDIAPFRERKVRLLNGTHSVLVPLSYLCGNDTVSETMEDRHTSEFARRVMLEEIVPSMDIDGDDAVRFAHEVLDRFANPFVQHDLLSIALHQSRKMNVRVVPSLVGYYTKCRKLPDAMVLGFAAFLLFVTGEGRAAEASPPSDEGAGRIRAHRSESRDVESFVHAVMRDRSLWSDLPDDVPGFTDAVVRRVRAMLRDGVSNTLESFLYSTDGQK